VEKDLEFLRVFLQFKGINYGTKTFALPSTSSSTSAPNFAFGGSELFVNTGAQNQIDTISQNQYALSAGVTMPLNFRH
jgi:hypothetical protein